jgi:predicted DNA binding CopG/RHH family protein
MSRGFLMKDERLDIRISKKVHDDLKKSAKSKGMVTSALARFWIEEKLKREKD